MSARNEQADLTLDDYYADAVRRGDEADIRHIEAMLRDIDKHAPADRASRLDQVRRDHQRAA